MNTEVQRRMAGLTVGLMMSVGLVACGGDVATVVPTAVPTAIAVATDTAAPVAPTDTAKPAAPTATTAPAAPTDTAKPAAPTATTALAAPTDTAAPAAPTATTAGGTGGTMATGNAGLLRQATAGMRDLKSYRLEIISEVGAQKSQITADVDVANKGLKMTTVAAGYSSVTIVIGDQAWVSADGGKTYTASPGGAAITASLDGFINMWKDAGMGGTATADENAGIKEGSPATEQIDGTETKHLIVDSTAFGGTTAASTDMWIAGGAKPTIRQIKSTSTAGGVTANSLIKWSKLDEDLGIKDPAK